MLKLSQNNWLSRARMFAINHAGNRLCAEILKRLVSECTQLLAWLVMLPLALVGHALGYRRLPVITSRIGHLAAEIDCFLKSKYLGDIKDGKYFVLAPKHKVANTHLLEYWRGRLTIITHPGLSWLIAAMTRFKFMRFDVKHYVLALNASQEIYTINRRWTGRAPILSLTDEDCAWGETALRHLGIAANQWFVCIHAREPGFSSKDDHTHQYRNSDPKLLIPAIKEIALRGGICVRMGHSSSFRMPEISGLIDYAHSPLRSDRLDIILCAKARFFVGNTSGLSLVSTAFGVPSVLVNLAPMSVAAVLPFDLSIPKLHYQAVEQRFLNFGEIFNSEVSNFRYSQLFKESNINLIENCSDDIKDLVIEMLDELDDDRVANKQTVCQRTYSELFRLGHYGYGSVARTGNKFLNKYQHLLFERETT